MALSLSRGGNISLSKTDAGLKKILIGLGWDERATPGPDVDLDASDFIFSAQLRSPDSLVGHDGDNRSGAGDGNDQAIKVALEKVPAQIHRSVVTETLHDADKRQQSFGRMQNAFIRVVTDETGSEIMRHDLTEDHSTETAMGFGEVYRDNSESKFRAVGEGYAGGLVAMCQRYGINASA